MKVKKLSKEKGEAVKIDNFANFHKSGSIKGMKKLYYGENAMLVRCGNYIYNVNADIYNNWAN